MHITVELSLYPLNENFKVPIKDFIHRLGNYKEIDIITNAMSTQIVGEHDDVFRILSKETKTSFDSGKNILVMKMVGFRLDI